ncbi:MAG TPA: O-antigen ligase family protein, partial [Verrucomicrobiae bacterium]|nr:O-antigen ligase family protein [Verrucomicrobiae bacterium]
MNREALDKFFERGILALVLAILIFGPLAMGAVGAWEFLVIQGLTICVILLWALRLWFSPKPKLLWPPLCWVVLAFTIYAVARYLTASIEYVARQELIQVLVCAFLFYAIVNNLYRQEFSQIVSFTLIFLAMGISGFAIYQFLTHSNRVWDFISPYTGRASGTYISPNNLAGFLEMILPLAFAYLLVGRIKPVTRILFGYSALVIAAGITVTFSRGGWLAVAVGLLALLLILIFYRQHRLPAFLVLIFLLAGGSVFVGKYLSHTPTFLERANSAGMDINHVELELRADLWQSALQMWRDHFWTGVGPAHYDYRFAQYRPVKVQLRPDRAHNDYLNLLADWGAIGGIIVFSGIIIFAAGLLQTRKHVQRSENNFGSGQSNRSAFFLGASAGLLALTLHSVVDFNLHIPANAILGVTLLALLSSNLRFATERFWIHLQMPLRILTTVFLLGGIFYLTFQEIRRTRETIWLTRAEKLPPFSPALAAALEKAFAAEPKNFQTAYEIGECYRTQSFYGGDDSDALAKTAMDWFARGMKLNPFDSNNYLRYGMCLDWLNREAEAAPFFSRADRLDPNGYFTAANIGWHYVQIRDYAAAREWFLRSLQLQWSANPIAKSYLELTDQKLADLASGK